METMTVKQELSKLIEETGVSLFIKQNPIKSDYSESGVIHFDFTLYSKDGSLSHSGTYFCGSLIPIIEFKENPWSAKTDRYPWTPNMRQELLRAANVGGRNLSVDDDEARRAIRQTYTPSLVEIVSALLIDITSIEGRDDWMEWAEEFGMPETAQAARELEDSFKKAQATRRFFLKVFQGNLDRALELSWKL